jgi:hypothetical protein
VEVGPRRLDHRHGQAFVALGHGQMRRRPGLLGQNAQGGQRRGPQQGLDGLGQHEHAEAQVHPAVGVPAGEALCL